MVGLGLGELYCGRSDICLFCRRAWVKTHTHAHTHTGTFCQEGSGARRAQLERLRAVGRDQGPEELRSELQKLHRDEVRELALEAGLRVRKDDNTTWLPVGELRTALVEHLGPQQSAALEEFAEFALSCVSCSVLNFRNGMAILKGFSG